MPQQARCRAASALRPRMRTGTAHPTAVGALTSCAPLPLARSLPQPLHPFHQYHRPIMIMYVTLSTQSIWCCCSGLVAPHQACRSRARPAAAASRYQVSHTCRPSSLTDVGLHTTAAHQPATPSAAQPRRALTSPAHTRSHAVRNAAHTHSHTPAGGAPRERALLIHHIQKAIACMRAG